MVRHREKHCGGKNATEKNLFIFSSGYKNKSRKEPNSILFAGKITTSVTARSINNFFISSTQADADDIDTWMLDVLRIVSSVDVGHDEFSTQALVKKHKDVAEEIGSYRPVIDALHEQSRTLPPEKANSEEVQL